MHLYLARLLARVAAALVLAGTLILELAGPVAAAGTIRRVKAGYGGANNGTSWANAYHDLQDALTVSVSGDQIWVGLGTYTPGSLRTSTFALKSGVAVYGGFAGTETSLSQRNPAVNITVLSGDLGVFGDASDNAYHVLTGSGTGSTTVLDGFTIAGGNANGITPSDRGGGLYSSNGSPTLANLIFDDNSALIGGGGICNESSSHPKLTNVTFTGNFGGNGGGMYNVSGSYPTLTHVRFSHNAASFGAGMYNDGSNPKLTSVTFTSNYASSGGGALYNNGSNPTLADVVFTGNSGGYGGAIFNYNSSPTFTRLTLTGNSTGGGGGAIWNNHSNPKLTDVILNLNSTLMSGGAMMNVSASAPTLTNVTFSGNYAGQSGGAIYNEVSSASLKNVTLSGNSAPNGGGIYNNDSDPTLTNVSIKGNTASLKGGGMYNYDTSSPVVHDSVIWGNSSGVYNLVSTPTFVDSIVQGGCPALSSCAHVLKADPHLGPLQNNGGFTKTMALGAGSAAIDAGGVTTACAAKDQRGVSRPQGGKCDMGAYEVRAKSFPSAGVSDGWVLESGANTGVGGSLNGTATTLRVGDDASNRQFRSVLSFDTSAVPDAAAVVLTRVKVKKAAITGTNPFSTHGKLTLDLKKPFFGAVLGLELGDFQASSTTTPAGSIGSTLVSGWYVGLLNTAGLGSVNKTGTTQLRLRFTTDDNNDGNADYLSLYSGNSTAANRPLMVVYYNP